MTEPSRELILRAQQGDTDALTQLIHSQQHYVYSIAMSVLKNPEDAADLTQEAFLRLFRSLHQYQGDSRFTTWLYRLVVNLGRDELRRRGRQVPVITQTDDLDHDPVSVVIDNDRWHDPEGVLDSREVQAKVRNALTQLDEHYRLVLTLYYFDNLKYTDIADILDIPLNTVKSHIRRGKERLLAIVKEQEQEQGQSADGRRSKPAPTASAPTAAISATSSAPTPVAAPTTTPAATMGTTAHTTQTIQATGPLSLMIGGCKHSTSFC